MMTTMTTLNDVRAVLIARGYPEEQVDAMLQLVKPLVLEKSLVEEVRATGGRTRAKISSFQQGDEQPDDVDKLFKRMKWLAAGAVLGGGVINGTLLYILIIRLSNSY